MGAPVLRSDARCVNRWTERLRRGRGQIPLPLQLFQRSLPLRRLSAAETLNSFHGQIVGFGQIGPRRSMHSPPEPLLRRTSADGGTNGHRALDDNAVTQH
jgi:hypothetical protein